MKTLNILIAGAFISMFALIGLFLVSYMFFKIMLGILLFGSGMLFFLALGSDEIN